MSREAFNLTSCLVASRALPPQFLSTSLAQHMSNEFLLVDGNSYFISLLREDRSLNLLVLINIA